MPSEIKSNYLNRDSIPVQSPRTQVQSPCIKVCRVADGVCVGCGRTLDEIRRWSRMDEDERAAVVARVEEEKGHE